MTADPRAEQLAESRYRNGYGPTVAEDWDYISDSLREFLINEASSWMQAAVAARMTLPTTEDLADADDPTRLRWGLNDVLWGDDDTVIVLLSGPDREPYWLELDPERAAVLRQDLAGPDGEQPELRDRIAAALYERERPPKDPAWADAYAMDREVFEAMAATVLGVLPPPAAGSPQPETQATPEAHPPHHRWHVETYDYLADEWAPGMRFTDRAEAAARYETVSRNHPTWYDGTAVKRRFVRETTSYTVEAQPAAASAGVQTDGEE